MSTQSSRPQMIRTPYEEQSYAGVVPFTTAGVKIISASSERKRILPGSTIANVTSDAQVVTFYLTLPNGARNAASNICEDFPLSSKKMDFIPQWRIPPGYELWGDCGNNNAVNGMIAWEVESTK